MPRIFIPINTSYVPVNITGSPTLFRYANFYAYKGFTVSGLPINNTNPIYIGLNSGEAAIQVSTGQYTTRIIQTQNERDNLQAYWVQGLSGDGLYAIYN